MWPLFSYNRQHVKFCGYCAEAITGYGVVKHCKLVHDKPMKMLHEGETPDEPKYINWERYVNDLAFVTPLTF